MKKITAFIFALSFSAALFAAEKTIPAVMLQNQGGLYEEENGEMVWKKSIDAGTELQVITTTSETGAVVPETLESTRKVDKKTVKCTVVKVNYSGKKYWVLNDRIVLDESVGVITDDCAIYRSADICDIKDSNLDRGDIITYGQTFVANDKYTLLKISYFDYANYIVRSGYIKVQFKSSEKDDLKAVKMITKIKSAKDVDVREELIKSTKNLKLSAGIKALLETTEDSFKEKDLLEDGVTTVDEYYEIYDPEGDGGNINIRETPGTMGNVVGQFELSEGMVYVVQRTNVQDTIGSTTDYWYYVQSQTSDELAGWIFGQYLKH
ncbi:MAG: SH3 domain-containing protein [Treponema sp.]|nr:SH3 domain-containing protein [Treponema sp.]